MTSPFQPGPPSPPAPLPVAPSAAAPGALTELLHRWRSGDEMARDAVVQQVYGELHRQASRALRRESPEITLQATALVAEAYLRLVGQDRVEWKSRAQFFGVAAEQMRRILIDHARAKRAAKRGGNGVRVTLGHADAQEALADDSAVDVLALHEALERLTAMDPELGRLVELRYFGGLSIEETAQALGVSPATMKRDWAVARAWLRRELGEA